MDYHQPLPAGWLVAEDSHGRIFFLNPDQNLSQWKDPRIPDASLNKYENLKAPTVVKVGFALYDIQQNFGFGDIEEGKLKSVLEKHEGTDPKAYIKKPNFQTLVQQTIKGNSEAPARLITERLFSLLDLKYEQEVEFRVALLSLIFLSTISTYKKIEFAFLILDNSRKGSMNKETLFILFKTVTRLVENHRYRYKLAMSNRNLVADVLQCLQSVVVKKGRVADGTITFPEFINFALEDPLIVRALSMLEKIQQSRGTIHHGKTCSMCGSSPIEKIRYKCTETKTNMCEKCFWKGEEFSKYKRTYAVIEYPTEHDKVRISMQKVSGRFLPTIKKSIRVIDDEARKQEYIDKDGKVIPPPDTLGELARSRSVMREVSMKKKEKQKKPAPAPVAIPQESSDSDSDDSDDDSDDDDETSSGSQTSEKTSEEDSEESTEEDTDGSKEEDSEEGSEEDDSEDDDSEDDDSESESETETGSESESESESETGSETASDKS